MLLVGLAPDPLVPQSLVDVAADQQEEQPPLQCGRVKVLQRLTAPALAVAPLVGVAAVQQEEHQQPSMQRFGLILLLAPAAAVCDCGS